MPRCAVIFPGQGAQRPGMGRDFCRAFAESRAVFAEASDALGLDVAALCFGDDRRMASTEFAQPALLTTEIAMLRAAEARGGLRADCWGGHSLGEYTALVGAGALGLADAVRLVRARGRLMQGCVPAGVGAMLVVSAPRLDPAQVATCLAGLQLDLACVNGPEQVVVSGLAADMPEARERLMVALPMAQTSPMAAPVAFHSRLLMPAAAAFRAVLRTVAFDPAPALHVTSNLTGGFHTGDGAALADALAAHVASCVRWAENAETLAAIADGIVEIGPASVLRPLLRRLRTRAETVTNVHEATEAWHVV